MINDDAARCAFSEFSGYETSQDVAARQTEVGIKAILGNPVMINAYKEGIPGNGRPFPEGSMIAKIEWSKKKRTLRRPILWACGHSKIGSFMEMAKRFPDTSGCGYAQFLCDAASDTIKPFGKKIC